MVEMTDNTIVEKAIRDYRERYTRRAIGRCPPLPVMPRAPKGPWLVRRRAA